MRGAAALLVGLLGIASSVAGEPQQEVMLHAYPREGAFHYAPHAVEVFPNATVVLGHLNGRHSLTSVDGLFNATGDANGWPTIRAPATPGTYRFYCWIHATPTTTSEDGMAGVLIVMSAPAELEAAGNNASGMPAPLVFGGIGLALWMRRPWAQTRP